MMSKGRATIIDCAGAERLGSIFYKLPNLGLYNISMINNFYVIIGKAFKDGKIYLGLGDSSNIDMALAKCIKELKQFHLRIQRVKTCFEKTIALGDLQ